MPIENLIDEIVTRRKEYLASKIQRYPRERFIASDIPDCDRYMVHSILDWDKRALYDEGLQAIFERGNKEETIVRQDFASLGFEFIEIASPFEIKNKDNEIICRGKIDGKLKYKDEAFPVEIKSMNMNTFNSLNSLDDFIKKPLHRKYLRQMQLYLYGHEKESGMFVLSDLQGHYKLIPVYLDYGECEWILKRIEANWKHVKDRTYPNPIEYESKICDRCAFNHICLPDIKTEGANFIESEELEARLQRRAELKPLADEYDEIDDEVKTKFKDKRIPDVMVGINWRILTSVRTGERLDTKAIPEEVKEQYMVLNETVTVRIINLKENKMIGG